MNSSLKSELEAVKELRKLGVLHVKVGRIEATFDPLPPTHETGSVLERTFKSFGGGTVDEQGIPVHDGESAKETERRLILQRIEAMRA